MLSFSRSNDQQVLDRFQRALDTIEQNVVMEGPFERLDPYIVEHDQFGHRFRLIIFHRESKAWYDSNTPEWSFKQIRDHNWLRRGDTVFDLGCNIGCNSVWYAKEVGQEGRIHSFDPFPWNTAATAANAELNGLGNIQVHMVGIADRESTLSIASTDARILHGAGENKFEVPIRPITSFSGLNPSFMKIDIEGAEHEVSLTDFKPFKSLRSIYLELHEPFIRERGIDPRACLENFMRQGFEIRLNEPDGEIYDPKQRDQNIAHLYLSRTGAEQPVAPRRELVVKNKASKKVALLSTWNERCGIAHYSSFLKLALDPYLDITVVPLPRETLRDEKDRKKGDEYIATIAPALRDFDVVCVQLEPSLFGLTPAEIRRRLQTVLKNSKELIVTFHSIPPHEYRGLFKETARNLSVRALVRLARHALSVFTWRGMLDDIAGHTRKHKVSAIAHSKADAQILKRILPGVEVRDNPLSYMSESYIESMDEKVHTSNLPSVLPNLPSNVRFVGVFGFIGPQKGFDTAILALKHLPENYHLLMFSGVHEATLRVGDGVQPYLAQLIRLVEKHKLTKRVHFIGTVSDDDLLLAMKICDAAVMPYLNTGQSASGPANQAVELSRVCYFTRSLQFLEMEKYLPNTFQYFDIGNYIELAQKILLGPKGRDRMVGRLRIVDFPRLDRKHDINDTVQNYLDAAGVKAGHRGEIVQLPASVESARNA